MQLVKRRLIVLPVFRNGRWYDDFAVTGASEPGYSLLSGTKDKLPYGIRLRATDLTTSGIALPTQYKLKDFELETVFRAIAGDAYFMFRVTTNFWYVYLYSDNHLSLIKKIGSAVVMASLSGVVATNWQKIGVRAVGPTITVFLNGRQIFSVYDTDVMTTGVFRLVSIAQNAGIAQSEWQYLAIKPL